MWGVFASILFVLTVSKIFVGIPIWKKSYVLYISHGAISIYETPDSHRSSASFKYLDMQYHGMTWLPKYKTSSRSWELVLPIWLFAVPILYLVWRVTRDKAKHAIRADLLCHNCKYKIENLSICPECGIRHRAADSESE